MFIKNVKSTVQGVYAVHCMYQAIKGTQNDNLNDNMRRGVALSLYCKVQKMIHSYQHELLLLDFVVIDNETNTF